jgi:hypothetical protein
MSTDLYRVSKACWAVKSHNLPELVAFDTIEKAASFLEEQLGIPADEVDLAIMDMAGNGHTHAQFGVLEGRFIFSDDERIEDKMGVA